MAFKPTNQEGLWGLDRIDQTTPPLDGFFRYNINGGGVDVCVLDTGIQPNHIEFGTLNSVNRVRGLYDFRQDLLPDDRNYLNSTNPKWSVDDYGHGTHIASVVGGFTVGVADGVNLYSVKVFNKNLETKTLYIERGLEAVINFHNNKTNGNPTICLCSWAGFLVNDEGVRTLVNTLLSSGVTVIATAGNYDRDVSEITPASYTGVISVGGIDKSDKFNNPALINDNSFLNPSPSGNEASNYGNTTLLAPSFRIRGAWITTSYPSDIGGISSLQQSEYRIASNNAIAAGFVAGVAALYLSLNKSATPEMVKDHLIKTSVKNVIKNVPEGTPNRLLKSVFNPHTFVWSTPPGQLISAPENSQVELLIQAEGRDGAGVSTQVEYFINSGNFPDGDDENSGLILEKNTGRIFGSLPEVSAGTPGYVPKNTLTIDEQLEFEDDQAGYVDYVFSILVEDSYGTDVRTFSIRVVDINDIPEWVISSGTPALLNELPGMSFDYKDTVYINLQDYPYVFDIDGDTLSFSILNGKLPPGLVLSANGVISGTVGPIYPKVYTYPNSVGRISEDFMFTLRVTDGTVYVDRYLGIRVYRDETNNSLPIFDQPNWQEGVVGEYTEGGVVNIKFTAADADDDKILFYKVQPPNDPNIPPETFFFKPTLQDEQFYDDSGLLFNESDWSWTAEPTLSGAVIATAKVYHRTPIYVKIDTSGNLMGVLTVLNNVGNYYFQIDAYDGWNITSETFKLHVDPLRIDIITAVASLKWDTPEGLLGEIDETYPSYFSVNASTTRNDEIIYTFIESSESKLPDGLWVNQTTGDIEGIVGYVPQDTVFDFRIRASLKGAEMAFIEGEFRLIIRKKWSESISEIIFNISGYQRLGWLNDLTLFTQDQTNNSVNILPKESWYRPNNENFGLKLNPRIYIMGGFGILDDQELYELMNIEAEEASLTSGYKQFANFWSPITVEIGDLRGAVGRDDAGRIIYEVLYYEIYDPGYKNKGISDEGVIDPIANDDLTSPVDFFYPSSIMNWRRDIIGDLNFNPKNERLPLWMRSPQLSANSTDIPGYIPCIEFLYLKPGASQNFLNTISLSNSSLIRRGERIQIDRITYRDLSDVNNPIEKNIKFPPGDKI